MSRYDKLKRKLLTSPAHITFEELDKVLVREGCTRRQPSAGSSHHVYTRDDLEGLLTVPYKRPHVSRHYVHAVVEWLGLTEREDDE